MVDPVPPGSQRTLSGVGPPNDIETAELLQAAIQALSREAVTPANQPVATPVAFVIFVAIELAFVFGLLVCTKLGPAHAMQITSEINAISVVVFFGRNAAIIMGRRMMIGPGK